MRCGEKCFHVTIEKENDTKNIPVYARTQIEARKAIRRKYGKEVEIRTITR
ncbi:hypothetical protein [Oceanobacillus alkalisoli]|uniref:hypothetical protein n=1 Tax=Oceanobacillus alkalisoli TaxID=2925113 RepID=UPI001EEFC221|nr:hypothetical protein [Oceanobacillus alkalisoli]MCF3943104.1 hypothetical protein [Oceanobacillus alkalisoli]MCG5104688.1 hypothetical protein [Oceanobacillus alkalisoli]